jgi:chromosome segregation ATPase
MSFSDKALGNGWHDQAARLVGMHGKLSRRNAHAASGFDENAAAREAALTEQLDNANAQIARLEQRVEHEAGTVQALRQHMQLLDKQFEDAERRADELEGELAAACDAAALHDNECQSLRVSLDLATEENTQLTQRLEQSDAELYGTRADLARLQDDEQRQTLQVSLDLATAESAQLSQSLEASEAALGSASVELARLRTASTEAANERGKLASELFETNGKWLSETGELREQLETMSVRAETAERFLTDVRECLLTRTADSKVTERSLVEMTAARRDADGQIKQLQDLLCVKQCQLNEVEQSRDELVSASNALLKTCQSRDTALAQADEKTEALNKRIAQLEAEARQSEARQASRRKAAARSAAVRSARPQSPAVNRAPADEADDKNRIKWAELAVEIAKLVKLKGPIPEPLPAGPTNALLASTITF